jgi:hypothetical protein
MKTRETYRHGILFAICTLSLAGYVSFSAGMRYWLGPFSYFRALFHGLQALPISIWDQYWSRVFKTMPSSSEQWIYFIGPASLSVLASMLVWWILRDRMSIVTAFAVFVPASLVVPQIVLATLYWPDGRGHVTLFNVLLVLAVASSGLAICGLIRSRGHSNRPFEKQSISIGAWGVAFLVPAILVFGTAFFLGLITDDPGYDALAYHLPLAADYGISNNIPLGQEVGFNYPANADLMLRWCVFKGNHRLAGLLGCFAALLIGLLLYKICRALDKSRQSSVIAASAIITFPVVPYLSLIPNSALPGIMLMLAAVLLLLGLHRTGGKEPALFWCLGVAVGLASGARFSLLPASLFITAAMIVIMLRSDRSRFCSEANNFDWPWFRGMLCRWLIGALLGGGFWYLRNTIVYGNPFYPISVLGLPGRPFEAVNPVVGAMHEKPWLLLIYPWTEIDYLYPFDTGLGALFTAIILPSLVWWPASMIRSWKAEGNKFRFDRVLIYMLVFFCLLYFVYRPSHYTRHAGFGIVLSFFLIAEMWEKFRQRYFRILVYVSFLVVCLSLEYAFCGGLIYGLARPLQEGGAKLGLPPIIDKMAPSRIFNAASAHLQYDTMGRDYRHNVLTRAWATPQDILNLKADYLLIYERQKSEYAKGLRLELVESVRSSVPGDSLSLYRVFPP